MFPKPHAPGQVYDGGICQTAHDPIDYNERYKNCSRAIQTQCGRRKNSMGDTVYVTVKPLYVQMKFKTVLASSLSLAFEEFKVYSYFYDVRKHLDGAEYNSPQSQLMIPCHRSSLKRGLMRAGQRNSHVPKCSTQ